MCSENSLSFAIPVCSALYLGVATCPLNPGYSRREFLHTLNISKPDYIFASESLIKTLIDIVSELPWGPKLVSMGGSTIDRVPRMSDLISSTIVQHPETFKACKVNVDDHVVAVMCSSGTTGLPKGVMLTDKNFLTIACAIIEMASENLNQSTISLALLPYFHAYAFVVMVNQLALGAPAILMPRFDPERFLSIIEKYKIRNLFLVPPLMIFLAKSPLVDKYDLSSIERIWYGSVSFLS